MDVTNKVARLKIDIPERDWEVGDQVCIKRIRGEGDLRVACIEHAELGDTLDHVALILLDMEPDDAPVTKKLGTKY